MENGFNLLLISNVKNGRLTLDERILRQRDPRVGGRTTEEEETESGERKGDSDAGVGGKDKGKGLLMGYGGRVMVRPSRT